MSSYSTTTYFKWHNRWAIAKSLEELSPMPDGIIAMLTRQYGGKRERYSERCDHLLTFDAKNQHRHANAALTHIQRHERNHTGQALTHIQRHERNHTGQALTHARCNERPPSQDDARDGT